MNLKLLHYTLLKLNLINQVTFRGCWLIVSAFYNTRRQPNIDWQTSNFAYDTGTKAKAFKITKNINTLSKVRKFQT